MAHWLKDLLIRKVSVVPRGANPEAHILLFKAADDPPPVEAPSGHSTFATPPASKEQSPMTIDRSKLTKEEVEYLDQIEATVAKAAEAPPAPPQEEDILKSLPEAVQKMLDDQRAAIAKAQDRADAAEAAARVEKEARERAEFAKMVDAELAHLPGTAVEKGNALYTVQKAVPADVYTSLLALLKAGNTAMGDAILAEVGDSNAHGTASTAFEQLATLAKQSIAQGVHKTFEQAFDAACVSHVDLWKEYRQENRRSVVG